ncbi:helix-turn-helix domain-containing protein [Shewanella sp. 10N.286.51.B2]|uniref:helix-turn-helix domain-containing protein n=1 Tax=Shewanella sp. 10N.286.51.B2 TaxID=3229707 RepID=UPI00354E47B1
MGKRIDPSTQSEILAMIAAGYTLAAISKLFGLKYHTVRDIQKRNGIKSGSMKTELVAQYQEALKQSLTSEAIKAQASSLLVDDLALATKLREKLHALMDELPDKPLDTKEAVQVARALSAIASSLKLSNDTLRASFKLGEPPAESNELPELVVREMFEAEVIEVRAAKLES